MKKTLVAIAVSSAAVSSMTAFAAEDTTNFDVYGNIQLVYVDSDATDTTEIKDNGSTFGFQGSSAINDDLTGFFKYELEFDADDKSENENRKAQLDQAYVGLQGNFGKVQVGSFDSVYNNAIQDTYDQFEHLGVHQAALTDEGDTVAYFSPSMGGFEVHASAAIKDADNSEGPVSESEDGTAATVVLKYSVDALTIAAGYDSLDNTGDGESSTTGLNITYQVTPALSVGAQYETQKDVSDAFGLAARYTYGAGDVYTTIQSVDQEDEAGDDYDVYGVGVTYNLSSSMYVYAEAGQNGEAEDKTTAVGATYLF